MRYLKIMICLLPWLVLGSCTSTKNISYFQDAAQQEGIALRAEQQFRLRPEDKINIVVNSKDPTLEQLFTLTTPGQRNILGASSTPRTIAGKSTSGSTTQAIAYTVGQDGCIDFPVLGSLKVAGMTRHEVAAMIKEKLIAQSLVVDPVVTVEYVNISVNVLGEVKTAGRQEITKDHYTLLDAIAAAGDLTINGERNNVMVMRTEAGQQKAYFVDLTSAQSLMTSPAYYLQQDDVVYVTPNKKRKRESTVGANTVLTPTFWISVASLLATISAIVIRN